MAKGKKRKKILADKRARRKGNMVGGGTSKYAAKAARAVRGKFSATSPFYNAAGEP
jgi:hypothetical protein